MDKRNSFLNVSVSVLLKILLLLAGILVRRMVIQHLGGAINGLNSLFLSLIDVLSLAELGVGEAMTYCMYAPAARQDTQQLAALYRLFRRYYFRIGLAVFACGSLLIPALPLLAAGYHGTVGELGISFALMLLSASMTYGFGPETALLNAHKNNYITAAVTSGGKLLQYALQLGVLWASGSYRLFLLCRVAAAAAQWLLTRYLARRFYGHILRRDAQPDREMKKGIHANIRAMFAHRLGRVAVNATDSILISLVAGVVILGRYSNYAAVLTAMTSVLGMAFSSLTSTVGHLYVQSDRQTFHRRFEAFHGINHLLAAVFFLGYYAVIDSLAALLFGVGEGLDESVTITLTLAQYLHFTRRTALLFRDATGTFYHDRWKPLAESAVNLGVSVILGRFWGITGVLAGTVVTDLLICNTVEPWVLYRHVFREKPWGFYTRHYGYCALFAAVLVQMPRLLPEGGWIVRGFASLPVSGILCLIILLTTPALHRRKK